MRSTGRRRTCIDRGYKPICHYQQRYKHTSQRMVRSPYYSQYGHDYDGAVTCSPRNAAWLSCPYVQGDEITAQAEVPIAIDLSRGRNGKNLNLTLNLQLVPEGKMKKQVCKPKKDTHFSHWFQFGKKKPCEYKPNMETLLREMCTNLWAINSAIKDMSTDQDSFIQNKCFVEFRNQCKNVAICSPCGDKQKEVAKPVTNNPCVKEDSKKINKNTERRVDKESSEEKSKTHKRMEFLEDEHFSATYLRKARPKSSRSSRSRSSSKSGGTSKICVCEETRNKPKSSSSSDAVGKFHRHREDPYIFSTSRINIRKSDPRKLDLQKLIAALTERPSLTMVEKISDIDNWKNRNKEHEILFKPFRKYYCDEEKFAEAVGFKGGNQGLTNYKKGAERKNDGSDYNYSDLEDIRPEKIRGKDSLHFDQLKQQGRKKIPRKRNSSGKKSKYKTEEEPPEIKYYYDSNGSNASNLKKIGKLKKVKKRDSKNKASSEDDDSDSSTFSDEDKNKKWLKMKYRKSKEQKNFNIEEDFDTKRYAADLLKRIEKRLEDE